MTPTCESVSARRVFSASPATAYFVAPYRFPGSGDEAGDTADEHDTTVGLREGIARMVDE